jgi:hypothetical protein
MTAEELKQIGDLVRKIVREELDPVKVKIEEVRVEIMEGVGELINDNVLPQIEEINRNLKKYMTQSEVQSYVDYKFMTESPNRLREKNNSKYEVKGKKDNQSKKKD